MMRKSSFRVCVSSVLCLGVLGAGLFRFGPAAEEIRQSPAAQKSRGAHRKTVKMLDDVYKTAIVLITDKYVNDENDYPAGSAAIDLFSAIQKKGWHEVRLLDVTGEPYDPENVAEDAFEKAGVKQLKAGKDYYEEIIEKKGKPYLRAMTPVPVVMQKCVMCHPHYAKVKKGEAIGAVSYTLPIE